MKALPKIADAANSSRLRDAIQSHLRETESHVTRLESIFADLRKKPKAETCEGMKGLIDEGEGLTGDIDESPLRDAGIIAANRVEHYGIAAYGTARTFAQRLGRSKVASLLDETLNGGLQAYRSCAVYDQ